MFPKDFRNIEATDELNKIVETEKKLNRDDLIYKTGNKKKDKTCDFQKFKIKRSFGREFYRNDLSLDDALEPQIRLNIYIFKEQKALTLTNAIILLNLNRRPKVLNSFKNGIFLKEKQGKGLTSILNSVTSNCVAPVTKVSDLKQLKMLTPKQMLQRLPIPLAYVKAGYTHENVLNETRQIIYSLYQAKEITNKVYNNTMNSIKL